LTPGHPGRGPFITWPPDPSGAGNTNPAAIVIGSPSKVFVRDPAPTANGPDPVAIAIRAPATLAHRNLRLPDVPVVVVIKPLTIGRQTVVKDVVGVGGVTSGFDVGIAVLIGHVPISDVIR